jgi:hypothetical protein
VISHDSIPYCPPCDHETQRIRDAIERKKSKENERDSRRQA